MKRITTIVAVAALALLVGGLVGGLGASALGAGGGPRGDTIVAVRGDGAHGFSIRHYDGTTDFPPTGSEARAECSEYGHVVARVRCRTEVRTWYRDLGDLKRALAWAHSSR